MFLFQEKFNLYSNSAVRKAWDQRKKEYAIKRAREMKKAEAEKQKAEDEKAAEKLANEKLVAKYRNRKSNEAAEKKRQEKEKQLAEEQKKNEERQERNIQSARARTKWHKTRARQYEAGDFLINEGVVQELDFSGQISLYVKWPIFRTFHSLCVSLTQWKVQIRDFK